VERSGSSQQARTCDLLQWNAGALGTHRQAPPVSPCCSDTHRSVYGRTARRLITHPCRSAVERQVPAPCSAHGRAASMARTSTGPTTGAPRGVQPRPWLASVRDLASLLRFNSGFACLCASCYPIQQRRSSPRPDGRTTAVAGADQSSFQQGFRHAIWAHLRGPDRYHRQQAQGAGSRTGRGWGSGP